MSQRNDAEEAGEVEEADDDLKVKTLPRLQEGDEDTEIEEDGGEVEGADEPFEILEAEE